MASSLWFCIEYLFSRRVSRCVPLECDVLLRLAVDRSILYEYLDFLKLPG